MIRISGPDLKWMENQSVATYPHECCGLMLGRDQEEGRRVERVVAASNVHEEGHERRYLISPEEMVQFQKQAREADQEIVGFFHSHPDAPARPSQYDLDHAWPWYTYLIISVSQGEVVEATTWRLSDDRKEFLKEEMSRTIGF